MTDKNCPVIKHEFYDLTRVAESGEDYCHAVSRGQEIDEFGGPAGHHKCDCNDYTKCYWSALDKLKKNSLEIKAIN